MSDDLGEWKDLYNKGFIEEIYQGKHVHVDLVDETAEVQIGNNVYSLSEARELMTELKIFLSRY
jgi:hypothetical protein